MKPQFRENPNFFHQNSVSVATKWAFSNHNMCNHKAHVSLTGIFLGSPRPPSGTLSLNAIPIKPHAFFCKLSELVLLYQKTLQDC